MKKLLSVLCAFSIFASCIFSASADETFEQHNYSGENSKHLVTEYYSDNILNDYDEGELVATDAPVTDKIDVDAKSVVLMEQSTGKILYESNADEQVNPASITKIMSLLLFAEAIESGKLSLDEKVSCSEHAASMGGSQIWLKPNEQMTVNDLLKAVAVGSANDATCDLAEAVAGSEEGFVAMMNQRAKQLGMKSTTFKNCSGLDAEGHVTTARDVAIMSRAVLGHKIIYNYTKIWMDSLRNGATQLVNTNKLVRFYKGATGLKTGTTNKAGCCLSASAMRDGLHLIAVVMGSSSSDNRFKSARKLLDYGFANYSFHTVKLSLDKNKSIPVLKGTSTSLKLKTAKDISFLVSKGQGDSIKTSVKIPETVTAPVKKGDVIGRIELTLDGKTIGKAEITAAENVDSMNFGAALSRILKSVFSM